MGLDSARPTPTLGGVPLKYVSLMTLTFQNSALILIMHYSRIMPPVDGRRYLTSTAVFLNEVIKLVISLAMALSETSNNLGPSTSTSTLLSTIYTSVFSSDSWKLSIPAILYTVQNTLQYLAVSNLDAATFQVTYQLKILTTALFSVTMLKRSLSVKKWVSLVLLMAGVGVVSVTSGANQSSTSTNTKESRSATYQGIDKDNVAQQPQMNASVGLIAVIVACAISGLAGVYFEKVLKDSNSNSSLWIRNVQLSFFSLFPAIFLGVFGQDGKAIAEVGFFSGYNWIVWMAIFFQAGGGILVALVVNYADNIAKNFATSISIIISFVASVYFFNYTITASYLIGTAVVLYATYLYSSPDRRPSQESIERGTADEEAALQARSSYDDDRATQFEELKTNTVPR